MRRIGLRVFGLKTYSETCCSASVITTRKSPATGAGLDGLLGSHRRYPNKSSDRRGAKHRFGILTPRKCSTIEPFEKDKNGRLPGSICVFLLQNEFMAIDAAEQLMAAQETTWLFSSTGMPVAFISGRSVYKTNGEFLGC